MCNGVIVPEHYARTFMMPVTHVTSLFSHHPGSKAIGVSRAPASLDVTASRTGRTVFLHIVNTDRSRSVKARLQVEGMRIREGRVFSISEASDFEVFNRDTSDHLERVAGALPRSQEWTFPGASVTAMELKLGG